MIKGIQRIKGLGVYSDYVRPSGTQDFAVKNLIYGWNYSGKTTLSRLFALIEAKQLNPEISGCSFTFDTEMGSITEANFTQTSQIVRVFNSDFIAKNLNFTGGGFEPILLLGADSDKAQKELDRCESMAARANQKSRELASLIASLSASLGSAKTNAAARIKKDLGLVSAYTATHLQADINVVDPLAEINTLNDKTYQADLKLALTSDQEQPSRVDEISVSLGIDNLHSEAKTLMEKTPSLASTLDHLVKNPLIERWVESGLPHHAAKDLCEFCGGSLSEHRLAELRAHFSKDLGDHKQKVDQLLARVEQAKIEFNPPNNTELTAQFRDRFGIAQANAKKSIYTYNKAVAILGSDLRKKKDAPFVSIDPQPLPDNLQQPIIDAIIEINDCINENNNISDNFVSAKKAAIDRLKKHYVQEFLDTFDMRGHNKKLARVRRHHDRLDQCSNVIKAEILKLKAIISQAQRGREDINQRLEFLLGSQSVQINVIQVGDLERFQLIRRDGRPANHLSEGEKTAIAFVFFLTKLKELKPNQFKEAIVYIDDPISSLDSNHIFQVSATIKETFFHKDPVSNSWTTQCKQVFFSTHNFEFFSLLRELQPKSISTSRHFLIKRINPKESRLTNMPDSLSKYSSEYHFLFNVINEFHTNPDKVDHTVLMLLPNAIRRFVELYTFSKYPGNIDSTVDQRADRIFGPEKSKRILKVLHYFSHANNIERLAENSELIFDIEAAVNDLFDTLKTNDPLHMEALEASIT